MEDKPDYVAEAASVKSIKDYAKTFLVREPAWSFFPSEHLQTRNFMSRQKTVLWSTAPGFIWHPER